MKSVLKNRVLAVVQRNWPIKAVDIASRLRVPRAEVTEVLAELVESGKIRRLDGRYLYDSDRQMMNQLLQNKRITLDKYMGAA